MVLRVTTAREVSRPRSGLADGRQGPAAGRGAIEAEQQHPLPGAKAKLGVTERDLLRPRADQEPDEALAVGDVERHQSFEQVLEVLEEARLPLVDANDSGLVGGGDIGDSILVAVTRELMRDV